MEAFDGVVAFDGGSLGKERRALVSCLRRLSTVVQYNKNMHIGPLYIAYIDQYIAQNTPMST